MDLDVVRGIAILLAMGWHLNHVQTGTWFDWLLLPGARIGWAGVDLFFVLSGFLVGRMLLKERQRYGTVDLKRFYWRRILRLWPVLYTFLFAMLLFSHLPWKTYFFQIALHIQNYIRPKSATHLWSLAVEEHFYLFVSISLALWKTTEKQILIVALLLPPTELLLRISAVMFGWQPEIIQWQTQFRIDGLAAGVSLAVLSLYYPVVFAKLTKHRILMLLASFCGFASLFYSDKASSWGVTGAISIAWISSVCLILAIYRSNIEHRMPITCRFLSFLGLIAYPLYLWHPAVAQSIHISNPFGRVIALYVASILVATLVRSTIELPIMLWRDRRITAKAEPVEVQAN